MDQICRDTNILSQKNLQEAQADVLDLCKVEGANNQMLQMLASEVAPAVPIEEGQYSRLGWLMANGTSAIPPQFFRSALFPTSSRPIDYHGIPLAPMWTISQSGTIMTPPKNNHSQ